MLLRFLGAHKSAISESKPPNRASSFRYLMIRNSARLIVAIALACVATIGLAFSGESLRDWTVADSISVRYYVTDPLSPSAGTLHPSSPTDMPVVVAPDGQHFFFLTFHGELTTDQVVYELQVFGSYAVHKAIEDDRPVNSTVPMQRIVMASAYSDDFASVAISKPYWENNHSILFTGVKGSGPRRIYRLDIISGALSALTDELHDVAVGFSPTFALEGDCIAFKTLAREPWRPLEQYPVAIIGSNSTWSLMDPWRHLQQIHASCNGRPAQQLGTTEGSYYGTWIAPNGKFAVAVFPPDKAVVPKEWFGYEVKPTLGYRFMLMDLNRGGAKPILDAPAGTVTNAGRDRPIPFGAFWSSDSRHVLLYNTALPLETNPSKRRRMSYIIDFEPESGRWTIMDKMVNSAGTRIVAMEWLDKGKTVLVSLESGNGKAEEKTIYSYNGNRWINSISEPSLPPTPQAVPKLAYGLAVELVQSANSPPAMIASAGGRTIELTAPDPALQGIWRSPAEVVEWSEGNGGKSKGLLMLPRNRPSEGPLPLIIQGSFFEPDAFRPDGSTLGTGFSAQALVAQGFAVLQIDFAWDQTNAMTSKEMPARVERIDAAVNSLAARGIADPERVGLIGFSRSGYATYYTITHPGKIKLAAAAVFDSMTASYGEYVNSAGLGDSESVDGYGKQYGDGNFWENKKGWLDAPAFNVDRVQTPVLFSTAGLTTSWSLLETVGAFRLLHRPFEYHFYPNGAHGLQRPREREAAMQLHIDWMKFWILGQQHPVPDDNRYERWQKIKADWSRYEDHDGAH